MSCAGQSRFGQRVTASPGDAHHRRAAHRAVRGQPPGPRPARPLRLHHRDDLRDHVAGALHHHGVADPHVLAVDLVLVVERRARDGDAADEDRAELRDRRQRAGAADAREDVLDHGGLLLRRELVGDRPARHPRQLAEVALQGELVHLEDAAVDLDRERGAPREQPPVVGDGGLEVGAELGLRADREAPAPEALEHRRLAGHVRGQPLRHLVGAELEGAQPPHVDVVDLAQRAGGGVARVHEGLLAARFARGVQPLEGGEGQDHLAAHRDAPGRVRIREGQGNLRTFFRFAVTSSPTRPSPRVEPTASCPSS